MMESAISVLSNMVATSPMWLLTIWNIDSMTKKLNFKFYLILINFNVNVNIHMATILDRAALEDGLHILVN